MCVSVYNVRFVYGRYDVCDIDNITFFQCIVGIGHKFVIGADIQDVDQHFRYLARRTRGETHKKTTKKNGSKIRADLCGAAVAAVIAKPCMARTRAERMTMCLTNLFTDKW